MKNHFKKLFVLFCIIFCTSLSIAAKKDKTDTGADTTKNGNGKSKNTDTGTDTGTDTTKNGNSKNTDTGTSGNKVNPSNFQFYRGADGRKIYIIKNGLQCTISNTCQEADKIYIDSNCELNGNCEVLNSIQDISSNLGIIHQQQL